MYRRLIAMLGGLLFVFASTAALPMSAARAANGWSQARQISDVTMDELASAVDSAGHVFVVGATDYRHGPLFLLTNASGTWVQSELAHSSRRGAINGLAIAVDTDDSVWILYHRWSFWNPCGFGCPPGGPSKLDAIYVINNVGGMWSKPVALPRRIHADLNAFSVRDGHIQLAWTRRPRGGELEVRYATNASGSWISHVVGKGWGPHLELDVDGDPWLAYTAPEYAGGVIVAHWNAAGTAFLKSRAPGTRADPETSVVDGLGLDSDGRPVAFFDRYEQGQGYWTYWVRLGAAGWTAPHRLFNDYGFDFEVDASDRMHFLYDVGNYTRADGLYYGSSTGPVADPIRIDRSQRQVEDGPGAASTLTVDDGGRPHVVFAVPYNENRSGTWYITGPASD